MALFTIRVTLLFYVYCKQRDCHIETYSFCLFKSLETSYRIVKTSMLMTTYTNLMELMLEFLIHSKILSNLKGVSIQKQLYNQISKEITFAESKYQRMECKHI